MEKYFRQPIKLKRNSSLKLKIIEWYTNDEYSNEVDDDTDDPPKEYIMRIFGVTDEGTSITAKITGFQPYYYVKVGPDYSVKKSLYTFVNFVKNHYNLKNLQGSLVIEKCELVESKDIYGFNNQHIYKFIKLTFKNYTAMMRSRYIFKEPVFIPGLTSKDIKFTLYESNFEPFLRYAHINDLQTAGWVKAKKYTITNSEANTQSEVSIKHTDLFPDNTDMSGANFLQASWDIEVFSVDGSFPSPFVKGNVIFQIATTYKRNKEDKIIKHLLTLKKCAKIDDADTIVEELKTELDLIKSFAQTIKGMDPDIMYTYNGDSFDCMYLYERAKLYGLGPYILQILSRLQSVPSTMKKEFFSSSAYGDSELIRMYIPGRLNYDLLIHFKRGMKKYASYKLDNIAESILGEKKNPVSVKEIFSFYESGDPERIREVGMYCIQDTVLLQKLVDQQIILESITQLANVTYVPISYLLSRGQTIRVLSQLYRKARHMGYLIPHTNFNDETFESIITLTSPSKFTVDTPIKFINGFKRSTGTIQEVISGMKIKVSTNTEISSDARLEYNGKILKYSSIVESNEDETFSGATVLTATPGIYNNNVAILDFASLYPTIMIAFNLCFSTMVLDKKHASYENTNYENIEWDDKIFVKIIQKCEGIYTSGANKGNVCGKPAFFEVGFKYYCRIHDPIKKTREESEKYQKKDVHYQYFIVQSTKGVIPSLLEELYYTRKTIKKKMAEAYKNNDIELANILNFNQMAVKVSLNSTYGFLGRGKGNLALKALGSIVTSIGRRMLEKSKIYTETEFIQFLQENNILKHIIRDIPLNLSHIEQTKILESCKSDFKCVYSQ
jgi:DNA polymerase elongation subunit (family B)